MSNKNTARELALTTAENLGDEILFKAANTFLEDAIKSIPFASLISGSIQTYTQFRTLKEQKQLLAFIQETEINSPDFINNFFKDKNNTELGLEILGILDQTYLEHQARMIGRATLLKHHGKISKQEFDKYTYIITKLNNYLILKIKQLRELYIYRLQGNKKVFVPKQPLEFINFNFNFIERQLDPTFGDEDIVQNFKDNEYLVLDDFSYFYDKIFKD